MKKQLTIEQHIELIALGYKDRGATIGDLIEFLGESWIDVFYNNTYEYTQETDRVCDALFEAVKEVLVKKKK